MAKDIQQIFKFSNICNILSYYSSLPKWMWLMKLLSKKTALIWNENEEAFLLVGKNVKWDKFDINKETVRNITKMSIMFKYFNYISVKSLIIENVLPSILEVATENNVVSFERDKENLDFKIRIIMKDDLEDFYPWMKWPSFWDSDFKNFKLYEDLNTFINVNSEINKAIIVLKSEQQIQAKIVNNKLLYFKYYLNMNKIYPCKIQSWPWKPSLISIEEMTKTNVGRLLKRTKHFWIKELYIVNYDYKILEENDFSYLLYFIINNKDCNVTIRKIDSYYTREQKCISWDVEAKSLLFVKEHYIIPISLNMHTFKIEGIIESKITVGKKEWYVFRLLRIVSENIIFRYDHKNTSNKNELFEQLKHIENCDQILKFNSWYQNNIKVLLSPKDIRKISIYQPIVKPKNNWFLQSFELSPRNIPVELNDIADSRWPEFKDIIELASKFKSISVVLNVSQNTINNWDK